MPVLLGLGGYVATPDSNATVWRYQGFVKFLALATSGSLFFPRIGTLQSEDPFEGSLTSATRKLAARLITDRAFATDYVKKAYPAITSLDSAIDFAIADAARAERSWVNLPDTVYVNCWHMNNYESAGLWKIYSGLDQGVAIRSTVSAIASSIDTDLEIYAGAVTYIDYDIAAITSHNVLAPVFHKRTTFDHEREMRLIHWHPTAGSPATPEKTLQAGASIPCDVDKLVLELVISPYLAPWAAEAVERTIRGLGFTFPVRRSALLSRPETIDELVEIARQKPESMSDQATAVEPLVE